MLTARVPFKILEPDHGDILAEKCSNEDLCADIST